MVIGFLVVEAHEVMASDQDMLEFDDDWEQRAAAVNEGKLRFLQLHTDVREHHHQSRLMITHESLETGWVDMRQCHSNLDATSALQIVFNPDRTRGLSITSHSKMAAAWAEKYTVQLEDILFGSSICLSLKTRALHAEGEKYVLKNGPFMRRFLDGYYPMRVSIQVDYPVERLHYLATRPEGVTQQVDDENGRLQLEARFEGQLNTEIVFKRVMQKD